MDISKDVGRGEVNQADFIITAIDGDNTLLNNHICFIHDHDSVVKGAIIATGITASFWYQLQPIQVKLLSSTPI